jgi:hypothetical protein
MAYFCEEMREIFSSKRMSALLCYATGAFYDEYNRRDIGKRRPNIVTSTTPTGRLFPTKHQDLGCASRSLGCTYWTADLRSKAVVCRSNPVRAVSMLLLACIGRTIKTTAWMYYLYRKVIPKRYHVGRVRTGQRFEHFHELDRYSPRSTTRSSDCPDRNSADRRIQDPFGLQQECPASTH